MAESLSAETYQALASEFVPALQTSGELLAWRNESWMMRLRRELSFSHLIEPSRVPEPLARAFYELQLAAGMNLHGFTTGRGTPYGLAMVPAIKVSTRTELAERWPDLIDIDAGRIATGHSSVEELGWELFHYYLDVASGRKKTWAEEHRIHNDLALFNPAPLT